MVGTRKGKDRDGRRKLLRESVNFITYLLLNSQFAPISYSAPLLVSYIWVSSQFSLISIFVAYLVSYLWVNYRIDPIFLDQVQKWSHIFTKESTHN